MFHKILVAVGGDDATLEPARVGGRMAAECAAPLTIVSVKRALPGSLGEPYYSELENDGLNEAQQLLDKARELAAEQGAQHIETEWIEGQAADRVAHFADHGGFDLLVMGTRRRGRLQTALLGSVSASVAARSHVPVMIVPEPHEARRGEAELASAAGRR